MIKITPATERNADPRQRTTMANQRDLTTRSTQFRSVSLYISPNPVGIDTAQCACACYGTNLAPRFETEFTRTRPLSDHTSE